MNTTEFFSHKEEFINYLKDSKRCESIIWINNYVIKNLEQFCLSNKILNIESEVIDKFYLDFFDINSRTKSYQSILRRPIISMIDFINNGNIKKSYNPRKYYKCDNKEFDIIFQKYSSEEIIKFNLTEKSKNRERWIIVEFLNYFQNKSFNQLIEKNVINYINYLYRKYSIGTIKCYKFVIKKFLNYLFYNNLISFSGINITSKNDNNKKIITSYTNEEIKKVLESIDTSTKYGKHHYLIMTLLAYYGLRGTDIIKLKFKNIDFENNMIYLIQSKTNVELSLPLIDEVKFALLDYLKNSRPNIDSEYIILTVKAPYTNYINDNSIECILKNIISKVKVEKAGIRIFRHSLATNMINNNVKLEEIKTILGHTSTKSTSIYIDKDTTHLRDLTLEVFYD